MELPSLQPQLLTTPAGPPRVKATAVPTKSVLQTRRSGRVDSLRNLTPDVRTTLLVRSGRVDDAAPLKPRSASPEIEKRNPRALVAHTRAARTRRFVLIAGISVMNLPLESSLS
jgi:hypothetical protein